VDAELILLLAELLAEAGVRQLRLRLSSLGSPEARRDYADELRAHLLAREEELSPEVRSRVEANPLRAFDSAHAGTQAVLADAPRLLDRLAPEDAQHFAEVRALLDEAGLDYELDASLVRGLDYYTRTVFEFASDALGAQSGVGGGGRYDGLVEQLGGPPTPAVGWAAGVERILLAAEGEPQSPPLPTVFVAWEESRRAAFAVTRRLRESGVTVQMEQAGRSLKGQLKQADRLRARFAVVARGDDLELRDLRTGKAGAVASVEEIVGAVEAS
jgi:histidyl-tRNA synthetase